ncbi:MAG: HD-GYP domain-containing protein, partial [Candidatus Cellulosilyticum pullistercoris]|nr:HD-GYP domain-containing protein [Candidatus Cellulosilyticum pullistercoris]
MTANRVYREGLCPFDVIEIFEKEGFQKYEPHYLLVFLERMVEAYINRNVRLSNGEEGQIIMINKFALSKPVVRVRD